MSVSSTAHHQGRTGPVGQAGVERSLPVSEPRPLQVVMAVGRSGLRNDLVELAAELGWCYSEDIPVLEGGPRLHTHTAHAGMQPARVTAVIILPPGAWRLPGASDEHSPARLDERRPLVLITPFHGPFEIRRVRAMGVKALLLEPFGPSVLRETLLRIDEERLSEAAWESRTI